MLRCYIEYISPHESEKYLTAKTVVDTGFSNLNELRNLILKQKMIRIGSFEVNKYQITEESLDRLNKRIGFNYYKERYIPFCYLLLNDLSNLEFEVLRNKNQ